MKELKQLLNNEYSLWAAISHSELERVNGLNVINKQKADVFVEHFINVFEPFDSEIPEEEENEILQTLQRPWPTRTTD